MKANRNQKINRICRKLYSKYRKNVISLVTAAVLLVTSMPLADISGVVSKMVSTVTNVISAMAADTYTDISNDIKSGVYTIQNADDFKKLLNADPSVYQKITVLFSNNQSQFKASDFTGIEKGLGNENYPFMGTVKANEGSAINLPINFALFEYLSDSANLDTIIFARPEEKNSALLAENVIHGDVASANKWRIKADPVDDSGATIYKSFTSVIGNMKNGANVDLDIALSNNVKAEVSGGDNAGLACGTMDENASLAVSLSSNLLDVSGKSNAGVFVGKMSADATLNIDKCDALTGVNVSANNAGGLVGSAENAEINVGEGVTITMTGSVTGSVTAGGLFGSYTYSKADEKTFDISKFSGMKMALACSSGDTADSAAVGSVFGVLTNSTDSVKISITGTANDTIISNFKGTVRAGFYGGIVGRYSANSLKSELALSDIIVNVTGSCNALDFGGLIGKIGDNSKAYVSVKNTTISINNPTSSQNNYGGLVGYADQAFIDVGGNVKVTANNVSANQSVGGIVGKFNKNGVVRLGGETNLSGFYPKDPSKNRCQIVGNRGNALIYSLSGWSFTRTSSKVIDDMDWGGVLRLNDSDLFESADGVLSFDGSGHTVTINGFSNNNITISNRADFARAALIMQHDSNDFVKYSGASRADVLAANISLSADVDISDTGLTGFMRDNGEDTFTGTLNGNSHKLTMTVGKENKIVFHTHNGLFAKTSGAKISNIMLVSNLNIVGDNVSGGDACYIGSVSAYNSGALTIDSVTANVTASPSGDFTNFVGGLVGYVADATSEVSFTDSKVTANLTYDNSTTTKDCTCLGGVIGMVGAVTSKPTTDIKFDNVTVGGNITDKHTGPITGSANARVGGLIAEIGSTISSSPNIVKIQSVSVNTLNIKTSTKISGSTSGGFIGHNWYNVEVTLDKIIVSNSTITSDSNEIGGLVLSTTGYWSIKKVSFDSVTVTANNCKNFGMLASTLLGRNYDPYTFNYFDGSGSYYSKCAFNATYFELTDPDGYKISKNTTININKDYLYFDEIARCSIYASNTPVSNRQAIISIPAVNDKNERLLYMDGKHCNTYQNQTNNNGEKWKDNPCARYYYNLDVYKNGNASTGGAKATVWSARVFAASNIKNYICDKDPGFPKDETIDLRGYSYYPVDTNNLTISSSSTIIFDNKGFNMSEKVLNNNHPRHTNGNDSVNPSKNDDSRTQHYMMQSGLFRNENGAVTISGKLTFKGNIGKVNGGSGALVCGSVADDTNTTKKSVKITGSIVLDDLYVNDTSLSLNGENSYAPLLINKIGNMTEITIQNVSQKKHSTTAEQYNKGGQDHAATSLIGNVGSENGQNISLTFSNIKLDASNKNSIFKNATLLESFQHSDGAGSSAIYNYKWDDDWGTDSAGNIKHNVTYGKEVSDTIKNVDNDGNSRQNKYHGDWSRDDRYTSPDKNNATEEYSFASYKPYVAISYDTTQNYDEIDVNLERPYLIKGCGTYSDPYILDASTLAEVARVISTAAPTNGWEVNYNANVSADKSTVDANSAFCKGNKHETYTYDGTGNFVSGTKKVSKDNMIKYLCEAYYKINDDIVLGSSFAGLGGTSNSYVFRGVIVGQKKSDGTYPTITNNSASPLIRFSSGSVVKNINIKYTNVTLSKNNNNKLNYSTGKTEYYGGVMGVVFGGDNIIDNVKVTNPKITFAKNDNSKQHLITAGGYVGAIVYGGVIFRNMDNVAKDSALTTSNTEAVDENADTNLFINPYIGRVVNGFAIEEGRTFGKSTNLNNGRKNYLITQFKSELNDAEKLNVIAGTTNTIEVPNAQALFMLSVISQSGMGYTDRKNNTCGYGHYTFTRNADYSKVGTAALTSDDKDYKTAISDYQRLESNNGKVFENKVSVMLKKYTKPSGNLYEAKWAHDQSKKFTVKLTGNEIYDLTDTGFRGINQLFDAADSNLGGIDCGYTLSLSTIQGNDKTIKLDTDIKAYAVKITDNKGGSANTVEFENVDNYKYRTAFDKVKGVGLINCSTYALTVDSLKLSGKISVKTYNNDGKSYVNEDLSTGGIVGGVQSSCKFSGITLTDLEIYGAYTVGGLIGKSTNDINISNVKSESSGVYVYGGFETGGLVGNSQKGSEFNVKDSKITINKVEFANLDKGTGTWFGVGGIVGSANIKTTISNVRLTPYNTDSFIGSKKDNKPLATQTMNEGGLIGLSNEVCTIENTSVSVDVYGSNAGGFVGINKNQLSINDCYYGGTSETSACGVYGYTSSGGMVGKQNAAVTISKSAVKNAAIGIPAAKNGDAGIGGYVGIKANGDLKITDCEVNNVTLSAEDKSNGAGAGGVIGHNDGGSTYAYDILINKLSYNKANENVSVSNLIGWNMDKNLSSKFIGVSVNNTDCLPDIQYGDSQIPAGFTAVHSDYNGTQDNTQNIGEGSGTHVDSYSPYVNINPSKTVGDKIFTGDLVGGNMQTIISDAASYTNGTAKKSYGINSTIKTYAEDLGNSKLTTFKQASELDVQELNDLPVLLIDDNSSLNITQMLAKYISVVTNCDVLDSSSNKLKTTDLMNVSTATYVYDNGSLTKSDKSTLTFNSKTGYFKVTDGQYDNDGTNRFTVITLDYIDPTGSGKTALRLHIPVFVRKVLDFSFQSYVISGTDYNHSHYTDKTKLAFESFDAPVTTYFKYSYYKSANEWEKMLNNGDSLLWSFDKKLYLIGDNAADSGVLTDDTKLTLVDANNNDKTYHSTASDAKFNKTTGELDLTNISGYKPVTMNDVLLRYASVTAKESSDGTLVEADEEAAATVKTSDGKYYRPAGEGETGTYKIIVTANSDTPKNDNDEMIISENYYLTINIPETGSSKKVIKNFVNYYSGNKPRKLNGNIPTNLVQVTNNDTGAYVIANFFTQLVSVTAHDPEEITASNNFVRATMTSKISIDQSLRDTFNGYKSDDFNMYQAFKFSMKSFDENDAVANAKIIAGTSVNVDYSILNSSDTELSNAKISKTETLSEAKDSYMLMYPDSVYDYINSDTNGSITVKADISLTYGTAGIIDQFPERKDGDTKTGIGVNAASYVAYSQNNIENSSISESGEMPAIRYYRKAMTVAQLNYNVAESTVLESKDSPFSQLGINAKDMTTEEMAITANAIYDLSALSRSTRDSGKKIQYTMRLYVKDNSGDYKQTNDISKYLSSFTLENATSSSGLNGKECVFTTDYNGEEQNTAVTKFTVKTGKAFEEQGLTYANYRVELTAVLLNDNNSVVNGTTSSDYVVYTNAKIETGFINS